MQDGSTSPRWRGAGVRPKAGSARTSRRPSSPQTSICPHWIFSTFTGQGFSRSSSSAMLSSSPASLTVRQGTRRHCLSPSTLPSRPSTLLGTSHGSKDWISPSLMQKTCCTMPQYRIDLLLFPGNPRTCNLITLISKIFYTTASALCRNLYKISELLLYLCLRKLLCTKNFLS